MDRNRVPFATSVALGVLAVLTWVCGYLSFYFYVYGLWIATALVVVALALALGVLHRAEGRGEAVAGVWWALLSAVPAVALGWSMHYALCGIAPFHGTPTPTLAGFASGSWLALAAVGFAVRGQPGRVAAAGLAVAAPVVLLLTWWQTDREGMVLGAATTIPAPALALLLADGRPADVVPDRRYGPSAPHPDRPLRLAVSASRADAVRVLLDHGADPLYEEHMYLSLTASALERGDRDIAEMLLRAGAKESPAAVEHMAQRGDVGSVSWLLDQGADPGGAMALAVQYGHDDVVDVLLANGAPVCGFPEAVMRGDEALLEKLLAAALPENRVGAAGLALGAIGTAKDPEVRRRMASELLAMGASPDAREGSPLGSAIGAGDADVAILLLDAGADPYLGSAMFDAIAGGRSDLVALLMTRGGPLPVPTDPTWLEYAAQGTSVGIVDALLDAGAPVEGSGDDRSPLCSALERRNVENVKRLLEAGARTDGSCYGTPVRTSLAELDKEFGGLLPD